MPRSVRRFARRSRSGGRAIALELAAAPARYQPQLAQRLSTVTVRSRAVSAEHAGEQLLVRAGGQILTPPSVRREPTRSTPSR